MTALQFSDSYFSGSVMFDSFWPHGWEHTRLPCLSPTPGTCSDSCPLSWWRHPTTSSSIMPFSFLQSFPASGSFPVSQSFASGGQTIRHLPHHNNWVCALEPGSHNNWDHMQQRLKPECPRAHAPQLKQPPQREGHTLELERSSHSPQLEKAPDLQGRPITAINIHIEKKKPKQINKWKE